jgi:pimeloyl-ACP methyl ester carboxylesterase
METPTLVDLKDGRKIEVRTAGPKDGEILLFHHGAPGAGLPFRPWVESAAARGLRTVMYSRPGYGLSTAAPGRKIVDAASDTAVVLDAVGATTFRTIGWSFGAACTRMRRGDARPVLSNGCDRRQRTPSIRRN